jgi:hypothetical protein
VSEVVMPRLIDLVGRTFGNLLVLERADNITSGKTSLVRWRARCVRLLSDGTVCGKETVVRGDSLRSGGTTSCGCLEGTWKHGQARRGQETPVFSAWENMLARCNEGGPYFGRFIYCEGFSDFVTFAEKLGPMTAPTLDRPRNEEGYYCGDCSQCIREGWKPNFRWATQAQQMRNTSRTHMLEYEGETMCLTDWERRYGLPNGVLHYRLEAGWPVKDALEFPVGKRTRWSKG